MNQQVTACTTVRRKTLIRKVESTVWRRRRLIPIKALCFITPLSPSQESQSLPRPTSLLKLSSAPLQMTQKAALPHFCSQRVHSSAPETTDSNDISQQWCYELATNFSLSTPGFKPSTWVHSLAAVHGTEWWLPGIPTLRIQWDSSCLEAVARMTGLTCTDMVVKWARSASESSNILDEFQHSGKDFSQTGIVSCASVSTEFCSVLGCFLSFQALYLPLAAHVYL